MYITPPKASPLGFWFNASSVNGVSYFAADMSIGEVLDVTVELMSGSQKFAPGVATLAAASTAGITYQMNPASGSGLIAPTGYTSGQF